MKGCLVDIEEDGKIVPWMSFDSIEEAVEVRSRSHSSWPDLVCGFDPSEPAGNVPTRRARFSKRGETYASEEATAFKPLTEVKPYYVWADEMREKSEATTGMKP